MPQTHRSQAMPVHSCRHVHLCQIVRETRRFPPTDWLTGGRWTRHPLLRDEDPEDDTKPDEGTIIKGHGTWLLAGLLFEKAGTAPRLHFIYVPITCLLPPFASARDACGSLPAHDTSREAKGEEVRKKGERRRGFSPKCCRTLPMYRLFCFSEHNKPQQCTSRGLTGGQHEKKPSMSHTFLVCRSTWPPSFGILNSIVHFHFHLEDFR